MTTRAKNYIKKKRTDRTLGQMLKAKLYGQKSHKEAYTYTLTKREKGKIYIYLYIFLKGGREQPNQQTNLPMIINSKY